MLKLCARLLVLFLSTATAVAQEKSLSWKALDADAKLDADGALHVVETQHYVFSGDWNGGERDFRVAFGQDLSLRELTKLDPATNRTTSLQRGELAEVDHYDWAEGDILRWRSRSANSAPFNDTELIYRLDYTLTPAVLWRNGEYVLDHDFAFGDRGGDIERFTLHLTLHPVWSAIKPLPTHQEAGPLPPGRSFPVYMPLRYTGKIAPPGVARPVGSLEQSVSPLAAQERDRAKIGDRYKWNLADIYPTEEAWKAGREKIATEIPSQLLRLPVRHFIYGISGAVRESSGKGTGSSQALS